jgi:hypothetical protein
MSAARAAIAAMLFSSSIALAQTPPATPYTEESSIALRTRAITANNRMYMQTRTEAQVCDIDEYRSALAEMEAAASEFHQLAQAVVGTGPPLGLTEEYFTFNDGDMQKLLERWRRLLPECEKSAKANIQAATPTADGLRTAPPVRPRKPDDVHVPPKPIAAGSLRDQALAANFNHAAASGHCDQEAMARYLQELDRLVEQAEMEMHSWDGPLYRETWMRKSEDYSEILRIREAARKRQAECPKDRRVGLSSQDKMFLDSHNAERALFGSRPLQWDPQLAASAKAYAVQLTSAGQLVHSSREGRKNVRENLLQTRPNEASSKLIAVWVAEKRYFKPGIFPNVSTTGDWYAIGHFTQMVWPTTTHVGCAVNGDRRSQWFVCHYSPPGNRDGVPIGMPPPAPVIPPPPPPPP